MIGRNMETWSDAALRRVCDAPIERWYLPDDSGFTLTAEWWNPMGWGVCLYGWACDNGESWAQGAVRLTKTGLTAPARFDQLVKRFGLPRVVRAVKIRALTVLTSRSVTAAVTEDQTLLHPERTVSATTTERHNTRDKRMSLVTPTAPTA